MNTLHPFVSRALRHGALWAVDIPLDGFISWKGVWMPVQILDREPVRNAHYRLQQQFIELCRGHGAPFLTWRSEADVISSLGSRGRP